MTEMHDPQNTGPIDMESALERIGGDKSFLQELLDIYVEDFLEKYAQLKKAVEECDFITIKEIGHSLKGASGNLSLNGLHETAYGIELSGKDKDIEKTKSLFARLREEFIKLKDYLPSEKKCDIEQKMLGVV